MILSRVKFYPQERVDLEDIETLLSAARTDSKLWTKQFLSGENYILKGFSVSGLGLKNATIEMDNATLVLGNGTEDFSYFIAENSPTDIVVPDADLVDGVRNYVELELSNENGTPIPKAFWDPSANGGLGAEFNQTVNTVTDIAVSAIAVTGGFTGNPDRIPLCIIDTDGSGNIKIILDRRPLFFRLGSPSSPSQGFTWASQEEPTYLVNISTPVGTFTAGETVTFSGGATATVAVGGTTDIAIRLPSGVNFASGNTITGGTSGATGTVNTVIENFTGADKDIGDLKEVLQAIQTEIRRLKGTAFWHQIQGNSLQGISAFINSAIVGLTSGARYSWSGTQLTITDDNGAPLATDNIAKLRLFGTSQILNLRRQDAVNTPITIADGDMLFIKLPSSGDRNYSGVGSGDTNYQVVSASSFTISDTNYWIAYRDGSKLYVRGYGELMTGESAEISDPISQQILTYIGALNEADSTPDYVDFSAGSLNLPNFNTTNGESLTGRLAKVTAMLADIRQDLNIALDAGSVVWDGTNISVTGASLSIPGTTVGAAPVAINTYSSTALAANSCLYVDISRTSGSALTLAQSTLAALTPSQQRLIVARNIGGNIILRD